MNHRSRASPLFLALLLPLLLDSCRSPRHARRSAVAEAELERSPEQLWDEWIESLRSRGLHPLTVRFVDSLREVPPPSLLRSMPPVEELPPLELLESVTHPQERAFVCDGYTFTVHVAPLEGLFWITRQGGIAGWIEHFGPAEFEAARLSPPRGR
jgi:hypothetical protein